MSSIVRISFVLCLLISGAHAGAEETVTANEMDTRVAKLRAEFFEHKFQSLNAVVTVLVGGLGLVFSVIGFIGIRTISQLKNEHKQELEELRKLRDTVLTVDHLKPDAAKGSKPPPPISPKPTDQLSIKLLEFLEEYSRWNFSPARIQRWGAEQSGFSVFGQQSADAIRARLDTLADEGFVRTRTSSTGSQLYGAL